MAPKFLKNSINLQIMRFSFRDFFDNLKLSRTPSRSTVHETFEYLKVRVNMNSTQFDSKKSISTRHEVSSILHTSRKSTTERVLIFYGLLLSSWYHFVISAKVKCFIFRDFSATKKLGTRSEINLKCSCTGNDLIQSRKSIEQKIHYCYCLAGEIVQYVSCIVVPRCNRVNDFQHICANDRRLWR